MQEIKSPNKIEEELLKMVKDNRIKGEWVSLSHLKAKEIMIYLHNLNVNQTN